MVEETLQASFFLRLDSEITQISAEAAAFLSSPAFLIRREAPTPPR